MTADHSRLVTACGAPTLALVATTCTQAVLVTLPASTALNTVAGQALPLTAIVSLAANCSLMAPKLSFTWDLKGPGNPMDNANVIQAMRRNSTTVTVPATMYVQRLPSPLCDGLTAPVHRVLLSEGFYQYSACSRARTTYLSP